MPAARGVKRSASKSNSATSASVPRIRKNEQRSSWRYQLRLKKGALCSHVAKGCGQLGLEKMSRRPPSNDFFTVLIFKYVAGLGDKIVDVCSGGMHTIALDSDGKHKNKLYFIFRVMDIRLQRRRSPKGAPRPVRPRRAQRCGQAASKAVAVSADSHSAALLRRTSYAWGAFIGWRRKVITRSEMCTGFSCNFLMS
ncbi:hypothetical protein MSG28_015566 [Choristoneura fumiferana]|uniref:Uncharacterized protein n=2 Tax=Choristoneura fumiferana TaxID=7141 RepID=A0ACC0KB09_CHOFU|nr:hypothetical protein MSG28_015566 [Choristoneura fumiferana]KAI8433540.1 hypothetical protein MSG28_015566 [Choristoneura fumiferana]